MEFRPTSVLPPPSDRLLAWFEVTYGVILPADFVATLRAGNGAVPLTNVFLQSGRERLIERMLCLLEKPSADPVNGWYDITVVMTQIGGRLVDDGDLAGMNVIPFACLFGGDFVCLDFRADRLSPVVAVWDHERSEDLRPWLEAVAPSFAAFDAMLGVAEAGPT